MPVLEIPQVEIEVGSSPPPTAAEAQEAEEAAEEAFLISDVDFSHLFGRGFLIGTPVLYLILAGVCLLVTSGQPYVLLAAVWPALLAGWYFGGLVELTRLELRHERTQRRAQLSPERAPRRRWLVLRRPAFAH
jgi:hypothetical protein